jgi:hypothetical protein
LGGGDDRAARLSPAFMSGNWFHQHFGVISAQAAWRLAAWHGPNNHPALKAGRPGERMKDVSANDMNGRGPQRSSTQSGGDEAC